MMPACCIALEESLYYACIFTFHSNISRTDYVYPAMIQSPEGVDFLGLNFIAIGAIGLLIFVYLVLLIRKRWKQNFLHQPPEKKNSDQKSDTNNR